MDDDASQDEESSDRLHRRAASESEYRVGFGCPPQHSRFQPGQSGNPKGRPRRVIAKSVREELQQLFLQDVAVRDGGKRRRMPAISVLLQKILADGLKGDRKTALAAYKLAEDLGVLNIQPIVRRMSSC